MSSWGLWNDRDNYDENMKVIEEAILSSACLEVPVAKHPKKMLEIIDALETQSNVYLSYHIHLNHKGVLNTRFFGTIAGEFANFTVSETEKDGVYNIVLNGYDYPFNWSFDSTEENAYVKLVDEILRITEKHHEEKNIYSDISVQLYPLGDYQFSFVNSQAEAYHLGCFLTNALQMEFGDNSYFRKTQEGKSKIGILYENGNVIANFYIVDDKLEFIRGHRNTDLSERLSIYDISKSREENLSDILSSIKTALSADNTLKP